jgi:hypothetical protein
MKNINEMFTGAIDLHVHCGPDPFAERRVNAHQVALEAQEAGMRAVVIKNHNYCTALLAQQVNEISDVPILFGSIALNTSVGGLNPDVVEAAAIAGAKIIWLPTLSATEEIQTHPPERHGAPGTVKPDSGIDLLRADGSLVPQIAPILEVIKRYNLVLATGHISIPEVFAVANQALEKKIDVIITHPFAKAFANSIKIEQAQELVSKGAIIEFCFLAMMPPMRITPAEVIRNIRALGAEHCILSSDHGQAFNANPAEGFRMMVAQMLRFGLTKEELELLVKVNPARLLKLS